MWSCGFWALDVNVKTCGLANWLGLGMVVDWNVGAGLLVKMMFLTLRQL